MHEAHVNELTQRHLHITNHANRLKNAAHNEKRPVICFVRSSVYHHTYTNAKRGFTRFVASQTHAHSRASTTGASWAVLLTDALGNNCNARSHSNLTVRACSLTACKREDVPTTLVIIRVEKSFRNIALNVCAESEFSTH